MHTAVLIAIVLVQVSLGIGAFLMLILNTTASPYFLWITIGHVSIGSLTLASSVALAMQVYRSVRRKV